MSSIMLLIRKGRLHKNYRKYSNSAAKVKDVYVLSAGRTPFGLCNGILNKFTAPQLGSFALIEALHRAVIPLEDVQNVFLGCALVDDYNEEIFRRTGLSKSVRVNVLPACGMENFLLAIKFLNTSNQNVCLAGGMDSTSKSFLLYNQKILNLIKNKQNDTRKLLRNTDLNCLNKYLELDNKNFAAANKNGAFYDELFKIAVMKKEGHTFIAEDEVNEKNSSSFITAKNDITLECTPAPGDGAAAIVISTKDYIRNNNLTPLVKIISFAKASVKTDNLPVAQLLAIEKALKVAELNSEEIARWEIDSIMSDTIINCINHLNINNSLVNKDGGVFSLGYPVGMFGIRAFCHLIHSLSAGELGCVATSDYSGTASAVIIKKLSEKTSEKPLVTLYFKKSCHLCNEMKEMLGIFKDQCVFQEIDIEKKGNEKYKKLYRYEIPVLFLDGNFLCKYKLDIEHFKRRLLGSEKLTVVHGNVGLG